MNAAADSFRIVALPALLEVDQLRVELRDGSDVVSSISFCVGVGEIVGLVGESGSGKTTIAATLLAHVRSGAHVSAGRVVLGGLDMLAQPPDALRRLRGKAVSYVPQDPATALNPLRRIGKQLLEVLEVHEPQLDARARQVRVQALLDEVGLPSDREFLCRFPHQLSGGQQQRVLLCLAFVLRPRLVVLDEPTTALDVMTQAKILQLVRELCARHRAAALYVSHDLIVVNQLADRVIVLYAGRIAESAPRAELFQRPRHPYTRALLAAIPAVGGSKDLAPIAGLPAAPGQRPDGCPFAPRCPRKSETCVDSAPSLADVGGEHQVACFHPLTDWSPAVATSEEPASVARTPLLEIHQLRAGYADRHVLEHVDLTIGSSECVALVGESGSGKTTLARTIAGLGENARGTISFAGKTLPFGVRTRDKQTRGEIQYVFQNPYRALNPRRTVGETLLSALRTFHEVSQREARQRVDEVLAAVSLGAELSHAYPQALSGGECQRVAIARALICKPRLLICDEVTSALDVSVQATILALLRGLKRDGLAILFVTHDLGVVFALADSVVVLHQGRIVEAGSTQRVLMTPRAPYTRELVRHTPVLR